MGEKGHLWLEFRPNPFSTFGDQVTPQAKKPRACSTLRASRRVFSEPAQFPVLAKLLSSQPDVDDEMGFRKHLRRIVSFLSDLDDASAAGGWDHDIDPLDSSTTDGWGDKWGDDDGWDQPKLPDLSSGGGNK